MTIRKTESACQFQIIFRLMRITKAEDKSYFRITITVSMNVAVYYKTIFYICWTTSFFTFGIRKVTADCGGNVDGKSGVIQSPGFPQVEEEHDCTWEIPLQTGTYVKVALDTVKLYYKDTAQFWMKMKTEKVCSEELKIGPKNINCYSTKTDCFIFHLGPGCSIPSGETARCSVYEMTSSSVSIQFKSDGEIGYTLSGGDNIYELQYPKGFKLVYSQRECIEEATTETVTSVSIYKSATSQAFVSSTKAATSQHIMTSEVSTEAEVHSSNATKQVSTEKRQITITGMMTTVSLANVTQHQIRNGMDTALIAVIVTCGVFLLLLIAFVIFMIHRRRYHAKRKSGEDSADQEMVYSVAYGRLVAADQKDYQSGRPENTPPIESIPDEGFVYSTIAVRQISDTSNQYATVNDTYQTMPNPDAVTGRQISVDSDMYSTVTTHQLDETKTKRKTTFRYKAKPHLASGNTHESKVVDNMLYNL